MYTSIFYELVLWFELLVFYPLYNRKEQILYDQSSMRNEIQQRNPLQLKANKKIIIIMTVYVLQ